MLLIYAANEQLVLNACQTSLYIYQKIYLKLKEAAGDKQAESPCKESRVN